MENEEKDIVTVQEGQFVKVHYVGTLDDGTEFDNSYVRQETLDFQVGNPQLLAAFNNALVGMEAGEKKNFQVIPLTKRSIQVHVFLRLPPGYKKKD